MSAGRFEIVRTNAGRHVRIVGDNGETLATSEVLSSDAAAEQNIEAIGKLAFRVRLGGAEIREVDERKPGADEPTS